MASQLMIAGQYDCIINMIVIVTFAAISILRFIASSCLISAGQASQRLMLHSRSVAVQRIPKSYSSVLRTTPHGHWWLTLRSCESRSASTSGSCLVARGVRMVWQYCAVPLLCFIFKNIPCNSMYSIQFYTQDQLLLWPTPRLMLIVSKH